MLWETINGGRPVADSMAATAAAIVSP